MEISSQLANQITAAIYEVVKNDINLINQDGIIISSTNPKRIGTFHQAGAESIRSGQPVIVTADNTKEGTQRGINYPIFLEDAPIAAVGITGNPDELHQFGFLITKITEVFLKEQQLNEEMISESRALHYVISSLIHGDTKNHKRIESLMTQYGLDPTGEFAAFSAKLTDPALEQSLRFYFSGLNCRLSLYSYPNEYIVIFDQKGLADFSPNDFTARYAGKLHAGLGAFGPLNRLDHSYTNAKIARKHAENRSLAFINSENITIELVLENLPEEIRKMYAEHILKQLTDKELHILKIYFSCNLSLKAAAEALFIHKNTLQYQLDRISEKCGFNPRVFQDAFLLRFAMMCS
ncbi:MAG: CdaR family transcriptional regulator [Lachnospiraceae bacterium]